jgi:hypothetical protein
MRLEWRLLEVRQGHARVLTLSGWNIGAEVRDLALLTALRSGFEARESVRRPPHRFAHRAVDSPVETSPGGGRSSGTVVVERTPG